MTPESGDMSEKEKMIAERLYHSFGHELVSERTAARRLCEEFNRTTGTAGAVSCMRAYSCRYFATINVHDPACLRGPSRAGDEPEKRTEILNRLFHGGMDMSKPTWIEPPFTADYVSASLPCKSKEQDPAHAL